MAEKLRLKPVIRRIRLNPEQAVLACACYSGRRQNSSAGSARNTGTCNNVGSKATANTRWVANTARS